MPVKVKICGITNFEDALGAVEGGADFLGFIFYPPSKRSIEVPVAKEIVSLLRQREDCPPMIGVFVNESGETMSNILNAVQLDCAQLSGEETPSLIGEESSPIYGRAYKGLRPASVAEAEAEVEWYLPPQTATTCPSLLIDTYHPTLRGGTGLTGDWTISAKLAKDVPELMLAGGLNADNVAEAVRAVRPFAVDVASGVEARPGKKDLALVRRFIEQAKSV